MYETFSEHNKSLVLTDYTLDCQTSIAALAQMVLCASAYMWLIESDLSFVCFRRGYQSEGTIVHAHVMEAYRGRRIVAPLILDFGATRCVVITSRALHPQERKPAPIECVLVGPRSGLDVLEKRKKHTENSVLPSRFSTGVHTFYKNLVTTVQNLVATVTRGPGFVHPWSEVRNVVSRIGCIKKHDCCHGISCYHMLLNLYESVRQMWKW